MPEGIGHSPLKRIHFFRKAPLEQRMILHSVLFCSAILLPDIELMILFMRILCRLDSLQRNPAEHLTLIVPFIDI